MYAMLSQSVFLPSVSVFCCIHRHVLGELHGQALYCITCYSSFPPGTVRVIVVRLFSQNTSPRTSPPFKSQFLLKNQTNYGMVGNRIFVDCCPVKET